MSSGPHEPIFYLLDYVTQPEFFQIGDQKKKKNWNYEMYPCIS